MASWFTNLLGFEYIEETESISSGSIPDLSIPDPPPLPQTKVQELIKKGVVIKGPAPAVKPYANPNQNDLRTPEEILNDALQSPAPPMNVVGPARNAPDANICKTGPHVLCVTKTDLDNIISKLRKTVTRPPKTKLCEFPKDSLLTEFMKKAKDMHEQRTSSSEFSGSHLGENEKISGVYDENSEVPLTSLSEVSTKVITKVLTKVPDSVAVSSREMGNSQNQEVSTEVLPEDNFSLPRILADCNKIGNLSELIEEELKEWENEIF